jgi:hypothetical protein
LASRASTGELFPIPAALQSRMPELLEHTRGFSDLTSNIDSAQADEMKKFMSDLKPEEFKPAMEQLGLAGNYAHGTHVAGITLYGNPWGAVGDGANLL